MAIARGLGFGQQHSAFEVASVRPVDISTLGGLISTDIGSVRGDQIKFENATLSDCIRFAYGMASDSQIVGPDWIRSKQFLYDIGAKAAPGTSRQQFQFMMQTLLSERFKLVVRREPKEMSYYALIVAKGGPKMRSVEELPEGFQGTTHGGQIDSILEMPMLAYLLSRFEREHPIIDETGLNGIYRVKLQWALEQDADSSSGPSLFTALDEQLGLKLEGRKGPVEVLVVVSADRVPTEN